MRGAGANMSCDVALGTIVFNDTSFRIGWTEGAVDNVAITASDPSNPRFTAIVAYWDESVVSSAAVNNPGVIKFIAVDGTAATPAVRTTDGAIQTAVGAGNSFLRLGNAYVPAAATTVATTDIEDTRVWSQSLENVRSRYAMHPESITSGLAFSTASGLFVQYTAGYGHVRGYFTKKGHGFARMLFTNTKDTYVDLKSDGTLVGPGTATEVANGAAEPAVTTGAIRVCKVAASGGVLTFTDLRNLYASARKVCTASDSLSAVAVDITGSSVTFEVSQASVIEATAQFYMDATPNWTANDVVNGRLNVDTADNAVITQCTMPTATSATELIGVWRATLASGVHTIKLRASNASGTRGRSFSGYTVWQYMIKPLPA